MVRVSRTARHPSAPPDLPCLVRVLAAHDVGYVIVGSVGAKLYGVELAPNDFDITPKLDRANLGRLTRALMEVEASLPDLEMIGRWKIGPDGESRWVPRKATQAERRRRASWVPNAADVSTLDHLMHTRHGNLDVVSSLTGDYAKLRSRARSMKVGVREVWVAHVDDLLAALTVPRRPRFVERVKALREVQRKRGTR